MNTVGISIAYFIPIGFLLVAWSGLPPERARVAAGNALMVAGLASVAYVTWGFAFQFGGLGFATTLPGYENLRSLYSPLDGVGPVWGVIGLRGFVWDGAMASPEVAAVCLHHLPLVITAALIPALPLAGRVRSAALAIMTLLIAGLAYPLAGNWVMGGGWLANLGLSLQFGHGAVDFAGAGPVYGLGGLIAMVGLIVFCPRPATQPDVPDHLSPAHVPLVGAAGGVLFGLGWMAWVGSDPLHASDPMLNLPLAMVNGLICAAAAAVISQLYDWLASGRIDPVMTARGWLAGWIVVSAGAPFIAPWIALVLGALAGIWLPLGSFIVERVLRRQDSTASVAVGGLMGLGAILVPGVLADGNWGAGWNGVGQAEYLTVAGQGVTGALAPAGFIADPGQLSAQLVEMAVILMLSMLLAWSMFGLMRVALGAVAASPRQGDADAEP